MSTASKPEGFYLKPSTEKSNENSNKKTIKNSTEKSKDKSSENSTESWQKKIALLELIVATTLWGFAFVATVWALKAISPAAILFYRFLGAALVGITVLSAKGFFARSSSISKTVDILHSEGVRSFWPATVIWGSLFLQAWGLQYTTAVNSSFITTLYIIFVPLIRVFWGHEKFTVKYLFCVALALIGTALMVNVSQMTTPNFGDLLTLACSVLAALHIIMVGNIANKTKSDFAFNTMQSLWIAVFSCAYVVIAGADELAKWNLLNLDFNGWIGMLAMTFGASLIAFYLQIKAQKKIPPSTASLLFLLESPVACVFSFLLLHEVILQNQYIGAGFIILAGILVSKQNRILN